jgi:hypothetical protein
MASLIRYVAALEAAGLETLAIEPIGPRVLRPFADHARRQRDELHASGAIGRGAWLFLTIISTLFGIVARHRLFEVVLVSARKRSLPKAKGVAN